MESGSSAVSTATRSREKPNGIFGGLRFVPKARQEAWLAFLILNSGKYYDITHQKKTVLTKGKN